MISGTCSQERKVLADSIRLHPGFMRSVNLWRDAQSQETIERYVFTPLAGHTLQRIMQGYVTKTQYAWTLTGPYGSGKSLFALFLSALLQPTHPAHTLARTKIANADEFLKHQVEKLANFIPILVIGKRTSPARCVVEAVQSLPVLPNSARRITGSSVEEKALNLLTKIAHSTGRPLLLIFDEMGKVLEYTALHPDESDLYFLQQLTEMAPNLPMLFVGILHQAFENYAHQLERTIRREWSKIQGRFEDLPFVESAGQMMRLTAYAIEAIDVPAQAQQMCAQLARMIVQHELLPPTTKAEEFIALAQRVYPLHPMAWMALPEIFRRYAQNSRSLFAFLASHEPLGFQDFLHKHTFAHTTYPPLLGLAHLFDYLTTNYQHVLHRRLHARPMAQALQFLQQENCTEAEEVVLKSLALLQWLQEGSYLRPTQDALLCAVSPWLTPEEMHTALVQLRKRSAIVLRAFNRSYHVWQGSDVDIEERLHKARAQTGAHLQLAKIIREFAPPTPLPARRHSYQTGTLRAFEVRYLDAPALDEPDLSAITATSKPVVAGVVLLCLPQHQREEERFAQWARSPELATQERLLVAVPRQSVRLVDLATELQSLRWVHENTPELRDDPVARRELNERLLGVEQELRQYVQHLWRTCRWFWKGEELPPARSVSHLLSDICDRLYPSSPIVRNELINRWILSSAAAAGRRNLIQAMLTRPHEEHLGIAGYPPERSIYESLLYASGIHAPAGLGWHFREPDDHSDPLRLKPVWRELQASIFTEPPQLLNIAALQQNLAQPPYGVTPGVFPILLCAFLLVYADDTTLYREGTFLPQPSIADWEVLLRRPELFAVAGCRAQGVRRDILVRVAQRWNVEAKTVSVVRYLVQRLRALPEHAKRTRHLSPNALAVRDAVMQARSPEILLFRDIPDAIGVEPTGHQIEQFVQVLESCLQEMEEVTPRTIAWARDELLQACGLPVGESGWQTLCQQAELLRDRVAHPLLRPLLARATQGSTEVALESVLAYVAGRPPRVWSDAEVERFPEMVRPLGHAFREAQSAILHEVPLSEDERQQLHDLLAQIKQTIPSGTAPHVLRHALKQLMQEVP